MKRRRDSTRVLYEILSLARRGTTKTQIVYKANLNFNLADRYVKPLLAQGFLREKSKETNIMYELTMRGERLHNILAAAQKELADAILMPT